MSGFSQDEIALHVRNLEVTGYTVAKQFLSRGTLDGALQRVTSLYEYQQKIGRALLSGRPTDRVVANLQNKDKFFVDLITDSRLESILMPRLNDSYYPDLPSGTPNYILGDLIARSSGDRLRLHLDSWLPAGGTYTWMMQVAFLLEDRGLEEGCTLVVPGSHTMGTYTDRDFPSPTPVPGRAGDLIIWDGRLWHGALQRKGTKPGWVVVATMQRWWVKPRYDMTRSLPDGIYEQLSPKQRVLCGYSSVPPADENEATNPKRGLEVIEFNRHALGCKNSLPA